MAEIRIRASLAVVAEGKILLVPHYDTDVGFVQWLIPGGQVEFGEGLRHAAQREFTQETGLRARALDLLHLSEVILPDKPYHSITVTFTGRITGGDLRAEVGHPFGEKMPRWFSATALTDLQIHPREAVEKALGMDLR